LTSKSFLMVSLIVFLGLPLPLLTWLSSILIYSSDHGIYGSSLYMLKPSKPIFYQLFYYRCYPQYLSNSVIPNPTMFSLTTHLAQHPHLCYTYLILVLTLNRPTLRTIQQRRSDCCPIELSFQLKQKQQFGKERQIIQHFCH